MVDVVVYNRNFREKNFKENIDGVFTLGQVTIEDIQALETLKEQRKNQGDEYTTRTNTLQKKIEEEKKHGDSFKNTVWEKILKENESDFQKAFGGLRGNKERFRDEVIRRFQQSRSLSESRDNLQTRVGNC